MLLSIAGLQAVLTSGGILTQQHHHLESDRIIEVTQIQTNSSLYLLQAIHQGIAMDIELAGGFGQVQTVIKESFNGMYHFVIEQSGRLAVEDHGVIAATHIGGNVAQETLQQQMQQ